MVTFELTLKQLYKNALIFAVIRFIPNLGVLLLNTFLVFLSFGIIIPFNPLIGFIPYIFLVFSLTGFIVNFFAHRGIRKHILSRLEEEELEDDDEDEEDEDEDEDEDDKSEYYDDDEDFEDDGGETTLTKPAAMMVRMKAAEDMDAKGSRRAAKADQVPVSSEMTAS